MSKTLSNFLAWFKEINQAGKVMGAYVDDNIARIEPGSNKNTTSSERSAWTDAANWAFTKSEV